MLQLPRTPLLLFAGAPGLTLVPRCAAGKKRQPPLQRPLRAVRRRLARGGWHGLKSSSAGAEADAADAAPTRCTGRSFESFEVRSPPAAAHPASQLGEPVAFQLMREDDDRICRV